MYEYVRAKKDIKRWAESESACSDFELFEEVGGPGVELEHDSSGDEDIYTYICIP